MAGHLGFLSSCDGPRSNSRGTLHLFSCLLWVSPQLSQLALALFQLTLGPNSSSNYFPLASPNPCHSTILGRGRRIGRWSLDLVGVAKKEWGGSPLRLVISAPERASKFHSLRLLWPPSLPERRGETDPGGPGRPGASAGALVPFSPLAGDVPPGHRGGGD